MNSVMATSNAINYFILRKQLRWAKEHLPEDVSSVIINAHKKIAKRTTLFVLGLILPICLIGVIILMSGGSVDEDMPMNAADLRTAKVGYDQELFWTYHKKAYELSLDECGLDPNLEPFSSFYIYVDENGNLLEVLQHDPYHKHDIRIYTFVGILIFSIVITILYVIILRKRKFAHPWYLFVKQYNKGGDLEPFCATIRSLSL